jgi:predicted Fe-Mo cluster-binding NifX family protein
MLIAVTVNRFKFGAFGTHDDNEEFILIGDPNSKPMYLAIALCTKVELDKKIHMHTLTAQDFLVLKAKYNDPQVSFFVMLKDVPHGEASVDSEGKPPYFYVTESRDQTIHFTDFGSYELKVAEQLLPI